MCSSDLDPALRFAIVLRHERPDGGFTCFLEPIAKTAPRVKTTKHIELALPPIVHGLVERDPVTLGQLADVLARREVDLIGPLREALQADIDEAGSTASADDKGTIILLHIPIRRNVEAEPDGVAHRTFLVPTDDLELGIACGASQ